jgi:hypothetical protein
MAADVPRSANWQAVGEDRGLTGASASKQHSMPGLQGAAMLPHAS